MRDYEKLAGLIPAVFTPMDPKGNLRLEQVTLLVDFLLTNKIDALYVCGSTGEGPSLTTVERKQVAEAYVQAAAGRLPVIIQVGHTSLRDAAALAEHAQQIGADAVSALPPYYFKPSSLQNLVDSLGKIAGAAPALPFYYYHIPRLSGVACRTVDLLEAVAAKIDNFVGIKYSSSTLDEYQACLEFQDKRFTILFGVDEMLLSALCVGGTGAVGSTYNFAPLLFRQIIDSYQQGDLDQARQYQSLAIKMIQILLSYRGLPAFKTVMGFVGPDCGSVRLPLSVLVSEEEDQLREKLKELGFFEWSSGSA